MKANYLATHVFRQVYDSIDRHGVKNGVDEMGLDGFITHCARLAATTGAITGIGGAATLFLGIPADLLNNIVQQFRVTLGVIYARKGSFECTYEEFMKIIAVSVGVDVSAALTRSVLTRTAEKLLLRTGSRMAGRLVPILGGAIGAMTNYWFIRGIGVSVKKVIR